MHSRQTSTVNIDRQCTVDKHQQFNIDRQCTVDKHQQFKYIVGLY
jgi:hypothetical protein